MKKITFLTLLFVNVFFVNTVFSNSGIYDDAIRIQVNSGSEVEYYFGNHCTGATGGCTGSNSSTSSNFDGQNFGTGLTSLKIKWTEVRTFKNGTDNITGTTLFYSVYPTSGGSPTFTSEGISFGANIGGGDQRWTEVLDIELISSLNPSTNYTLEIYSTAAFTYDSGSGTHFNDAGGSNFKATFTTAAAMPVELISFNVMSTKNKNTLLWQTATEINNSHFDIQRSNDSKTWNSIGQIDGKGNSLQAQDYAYVDEKPLNPTNYYRLKQVDFDNKFSYSPIVMVENNTLDISVFPNPANDYFYLKIPNTSDKKYKVQLINTKGQVSFQMATKATFLKIEINDLLPGLYVLRLTDELGSLLFAERLSKL